MPPGMSFRAVADAIKEIDPDARGADKSSVKLYEEGKREAGARYLLAFCEVTGCSAEFLLRGEGEPKKTQPAEAVRRLWLVTQAVEADDVTAVEDMFGAILGGGSPREDVEDEGP